MSQWNRDFLNVKPDKNVWPNTWQRPGVSVRDLTWRGCQSHHAVEGEWSCFKLHPLLSSLHLHFPLWLEDSGATRNKVFINKLCSVQHIHFPIQLCPHIKGHTRSFLGLYLYYGSLLENVSHSFSHTVYFCSTTIHPLMECSILVPIILAYSDWSGFAGLSRHPPLSLRSSSASAFAVTDRRREQRSVNVVNMQNWQR